VKGSIILAAVFLCAMLAVAYWPRVGNLIDRWHDWRLDRAFRRRHRRAFR